MITTKQEVPMNPPAAQVWTIGALLTWTEKFFAQKGVESPRLDAQVLLAHSLGCKRIDLYARSTEEAPETQRVQFRDLVRRRVEGCPVAYLVGTKEFYLLSFEVTPAVLIPRPATEALVLAALERLKSLSVPRVLDIGTGSACLAVSIAKQNAGATVIATDISTDALAVARRNVERHAVANRVRLIESDLFAGLNSESPFDLILSNPPYVRTGDFVVLAPDVSDHEPRQALDGGPDGFAVIDRLLKDAPVHLAPGGWLLVEIGSDQGDVMLTRLRTTPGLAEAQILPDRDGHARVAVARRTV
jgi:release factor glutamine methyltransferase